MNKLFGAGLLGLTLLLSGCSSDSNSDKTNPTVTLTAVPTVTAAGAVAVTATATDNVAVQSVAFYDNDTLVGSLDTAAPYNATLNYTAANNGVHTIKAVATDTSGNTASTTTKVTVNIPTVTADTTLPVITGLTLTPSTISSAAPQAVVITGKATDNVAVKQVVITVKAFAMGQDLSIPLPAVTPDASGNFNVSITPALLGQYVSALALIDSATITAVATDTAGNNSAPVSQTLTITH